MRTLLISKNYVVYILQSTKDDDYYIGYSSDLDARLKQHNSGSTRSLKHRLPMKLIYFEEYDEKSVAKAREKQIKSYKGGEAFLKLIGSPRLRRGLVPL